MEISPEKLDKLVIEWYLEISSDPESMEHLRSVPFSKFLKRRKIVRFSPNPTT